MSAKAFAAWCAAFLAVCAVLGVALKVTQRETPRPEGVAERWLAAVSDTTRKGVQDDARRRARELADVDLGPAGTSFGPAGAAAAEAGKTLFTSIEVGRARGGRVPYRVQVREGEELRNTAVVAERGGRPVVVAVDARRSGELVPSEGGDPPSRASAVLWVAAIAIAAALTAGASALVRLAGRPPVA